MASTNGRSDYEAIKQDIAGLKGQLADLMGHARQAADNQARRGYEGLSRRGDHAVQAATDRVRERPISSIFMALAVGYLLSWLTRR